MRIAGLDEAGRGSLLGPLAVAIVVVRAEDQASLRAAGAKDSKLLPPRSRERVARAVMRIADWRVLLIPPWAVDRSTRARGGNLNRLEAAAFAKLISAANPDIAIVDSPDPVAERFGSLVEGMAAGMGARTRVLARHHADLLYPVVGAASVVAKVHRDRAIAAYRARYGDLGSGYPHDGRTLRFLLSWTTRWRDYPYIARREWATLRRIEQKDRGT